METFSFRQTRLARKQQATGFGYTFVCITHFEEAQTTDTGLMVTTQS